MWRVVQTGDLFQTILPSGWHGSTRRRAVHGRCRQHHAIRLASRRGHARSVPAHEQRDRAFLHTPSFRTHRRHRQEGATKEDRRHGSQPEDRSASPLLMRNAGAGVRWGAQARVPGSAVCSPGTPLPGGFLPLFPSTPAPTVGRLTTARIEEARADGAALPGKRERQRTTLRRRFRLSALGLAAERAGNPLHVELLRPVVVVNAVLFLFDIGELGVAVAADVRQGQ